MRKRQFIWVLSALVIGLTAAWLTVKGDSLDAFKCYTMTPEKFKIRYEEELRGVVYSPKPTSPVVEVVLRLEGLPSMDAEKLLVIYSNKADALVYRGPVVNLIKVPTDAVLRADDGGDNLKFQLLDARARTICVCEQQTGYGVWATGKEVAIKFLAGRQMDRATGTPRRFLVDGQ